MSETTNNPWLKADADRRVDAEDTTTPTPAPDETADINNPWAGLSVPASDEPEPEADAEAEEDAQDTAPEEWLPDAGIAARSRSVGGAGYIAADTGRRDRRGRRRAAQERERAQRKVLMRERRATMEAEKQSRKDANYLPAMGEGRPEAGRAMRKLKLESHRATSEVLAVGYPFLAEAGLGSEGTLIGHDSWSGAAFCYDPWNLYKRQIVTNPNVLLAGVIGRGKSSLAKSLATRSIAFGRKVYVPGDPKGEWTAVARAVGGASISLGAGMTTRINPLDEGPRPGYWVDSDGGRQPMTDEMWKSVVMNRRRALVRALTEQALGRDLHSVEMTALFGALDVVVRDQPTPVLPHVVQRMMEPSEGVMGSSVDQLRDDGRAAAHSLARIVTGDLAGLFDGESTTRFDAGLPMLTFDMSRMEGNDMMVALAMTCASAWMEAALADPDGGQRWVVYDEAWRLMRLAALLARMQTQWKLSRHWGIANLMIIHRVSDLAAVGESDSASRNLARGLLADCSTRIIYMQESGAEAEHTGSEIGLSGTEILQLPTLARGEGLWRIGERAFVVSHDATPAELELYDTNKGMQGSGSVQGNEMAAAEAVNATGEGAG